MVNNQPRETGMAIFLSKQLREEKKIISELKNKIKQSKNIKYVSPSYSENGFREYYLDDLILKFHIDPGRALLVVCDKSGKKIIKMDYESWHADANKPKYKWIDKLEDLAQKCYQNIHADEISRKKFKAAQEALESANKIKKEQDAKLIATHKALQKIQSL
jgi:hypothetical protein